MTQQFDAFGLPLDEATTRGIDLPQAREVRKPRLHDVLAEASRDDIDDELIQESGAK